MKALLAVGGTLIGALFGFAVFKTVNWIRGETVLPDGAQFENLDDLRRAMLSRDPKDVRSDGSVSLRGIIQPDPSDLIIYRLQPNLDVKFEGAPVRTNSHGLRGPEIAIEKPAGTYRVALLGDSFAFGWGVEAEESFAQVMERTLNERLAGEKKIEVLNFGVPGYSTFQEVALFEEQGLKFQPDAVLVYFIENDFGLPFFVKNFNSSEQLVNNKHFQSLKEQSENTEAEDDHRALLKNLDSNRALRRLGEVGAEKGIKVFFVVNPGKNFDKSERRLARSRKNPALTMLSIREEVLAEIAARSLAPKELRLPRDPHPSALKHDILGRALADKLLPFIRQ